MKKINTQEIPVKSTFVSLWMTVAMVLAFTGCSEEDLMQPANGQSGSLHITSVSVDGQQVGGRSRVAYEGSDTPVSINDLPANHSITGFSAGDEITLKYGFYEIEYSYELWPVTARFDGSGWTITDNELYNGDDVINPDFSCDEKWADITMEAIVEPASEAPRSLGRQARSTSDYVLGNINIANVKQITDCLYASTEDGSITVDTNLNSPTLGATTIRFKHQDALLRLAIPESGFNVAGTYVVDGTAYNVTGLATLWAFLDGNNRDWYVPFTQVGNNLQAIVYDTYYTLAGFKAVLYATEVAAENTPMPSSTGSEPSTITIDLPFKVGGSASTGIVLEENTQYPLTLNISPNQAVVNLASATGKPGWALDVTETELSNAENERNFGIAKDCFEVYSAEGLQHLNKWMTGQISDAEFYTGELANSTYRPATALSSNIKLMKNITLPTVGNGESNWTPIGGYNGTTYTTYTGTFDGNGKTITNLVINSDAIYVGLIGRLYSGNKVQNLTLVDAIINATNSTATDRYVGSIAGEVCDGSVINCCSDGNITVDASGNGNAYVGGIVGYIHSSRKKTIMVGCINNASINYSQSSSSIYNIGGVAGYISENIAYCIACANLGDITVPNGLAHGDWSNYNGLGDIIGYASGSIYGCWSKSTNVSRKSNIQGIGNYKNQTVIGTYSGIYRGELTEQAFINDKVRDMNTAIVGVTLPEGVTNYYWVAGANTNTDWPTLQKEDTNN